MDFLDWAATLLLVLTFAVVITYVVSARRRQPRPFTGIDHSRAVAIGVDSAMAFSGFEFVGNHPPRFIFRVHDDLTWSIMFALSIYAPDRDIDLSGMPPVVLVLPRDASALSPGQMIGVNRDGLMVGERFGKCNSTIERRGTTPKSVIYEVRPLSLTIEAISNRPILRYELRCRVKSTNTTSAGLGARHFEILYMPSLAESAGLVPGFGALRPPRSIGPIGNFFCVAFEPQRDNDGKGGRVKADPDQCSPRPAFLVDERSCNWNIWPDQAFTVQGTVMRASVAHMNALRSYLLTAAGTGLIGAIVALYVRR